MNRKELLCILLCTALSFGLISGCDNANDAPVVTPVVQPDSEPSPEPTPEPDRDALFASYVSEFPFYTYSGRKSNEWDGRAFIMEDTPKNRAEAVVAECYGLSEPASNYKMLTIHELATLTPEDFTTENMPYLDSFLRELAEDVQEYGLTEYTVVYVNKTWEWTDEALALGPQLGDGRYEWLYLLGKTKPDDAWKPYECYWGEYVFGRIYSDEDNSSAVLTAMANVKGSDFINPEYFGNITAEQLAAALNAAVDHQISEAEFMDAIGGAYGSVFPHWYIENAWLEGGPNAFSSLDRHLSVNCGLPENIVEVTLSEDNHRETAYFEDAALYQMVRHKNDYEETIDSQAYGQFKDILLPKMESALSLMENNPGNFTGYELTRFTPVWRYEDSATGNSVVLYDFFFGLLTDTPETVGWAGGMAFDSKLRLVGLNVPVQLAVQYRGNAIRAAFMAPEFYYDPADTDLAAWAMEHINHVLDQVQDGE